MNRLPEGAYVTSDSVECAAAANNDKVVNADCPAHASPSANQQVQQLSSPMDQAGDGSSSNVPNSPPSAKVAAAQQPPSSPAQADSNPAAALDPNSAVTAAQSVSGATTTSSSSTSSVTPPATVPPAIAQSSPPPPTHSVITVASTSTVIASPAVTSTILSTLTSTTTQQQPGNPAAGGPVAQELEAPQEPAGPTIAQATQDQETKQDAAQKGNDKLPPEDAAQVRTPNESSASKDNQAPPAGAAPGPGPKERLAPKDNPQAPSAEAAPAQDASQSPASKGKPQAAPEATPVESTPARGLNGSPASTQRSQASAETSARESKQGSAVTGNGQAPAVVATPVQGPKPKPMATGEIKPASIEAAPDQDQDPAAPTKGIKTPSVAVAEGQVPSPSPPPSTQPPTSGGAVPISKPSSLPTTGTSPGSQNTAPARDRALVAAGFGSFNSVARDGTLPTRTTLETSASAGTPEEAPAATTPVASQPAPLPLNSTNPSSSSGPNQPQSSRPLGNQSGGRGDSGDRDVGVGPRPSPRPGPPRQSSRSLPTGGIVGISVGGLAVLSLMLLLVFLCRRKRAQRRGDRLPSPFATNGERETAELSGHAASTGTGTEDLAAATIFPGRRPRWPGSAANGAWVNRNRGPPQILERPAEPRSAEPRPDELAAARPASNVLTVKDRELDWWPRKAEDNDFNTRVRAERGVPVAGHMGNGSSSSNALRQFRPGLNMGFDGLGGNLDPFSDRHATSGEAAYYSPRAAGAGPSKPFSDAAARWPRQQSRWPIGPVYPQYGPGVGLQARGRALSATARNSQYPPPSMAFRPSAHRPPSAHRESLESVDSFADRRNKFRSDPFDLEIQSRLIPNATEVAQMPRNMAMSSRYSSHTRASSLGSSRYTSVLSMSEWGDSGAEATAAAARRSAGPTRRSSDFNVGETGAVVGQAL